MTQSVDERLSFIKEHAVKDVATMKAVVQEEWDRVLSLIDGLSQAQAEFKPGSEEFSIANVIGHLNLNVERTRDRIAAMANGQAIDMPGRPGMLPPDEGLTFNQRLQNYRQAIDSIQALVDGQNPSANLNLTTNHPAYGPLNWREWFVYLRVHHADHTQQLKDIKASSGFPKA